MLDGFNTYNLQVNNNILSNDLLDFPLSINVGTGEQINQSRYSKYKGLIFKISPQNKLSLKGSFHKYHNDGGHNYNDFNFDDIKTVLNQFQTLFNIDIQRTTLNNLEFGVNIKTNLKINDILKSIVCYKNKRFQKFDISGAKGIQCINQQYIIKIYDKSHHYKQNENIIRFEVKVIKMQFFKNHNVNINTLETLLNINEISKLKGILLDVWDKIHFTDYDIYKINLKSLESGYFDYGNNPERWFRSTKSQSKKHYRHIRKFKELVNKYSTKNYQTILSNEIRKKCNELIPTTQKNGGILTDTKDNLTQKNGGKLTNVLTVKNGGILTTKKII